MSATFYYFFSKNQEFSERSENCAKSLNKYFVSEYMKFLLTRNCSEKFYQILINLPVSILRKVSASEHEELR